MKRQDIIPIINKHCKEIRQNIRMMMSGFEEEPVHEFRTGIKKLRALLRLLNAGYNSGLTGLTKKIRVYYWYAGSIRNLQLHQNNINAMNIDKPAAYLERVNNQVEALQGALRSLHSPANFKKINSIIRNRPDGKRRILVKKFIRQKMDEFKKLMGLLKNDEDIHSVRKILKDLLYNWKYIRKYRDMLPPVLSTKKQISAMTVVLGDFCDRSTGIHLIESYIMSTAEPDDKDILQEIRRIWEVEKNELRAKLFLMLSYKPA
jgi:CHAD domain-containing protein